MSDPFRIPNEQRSAGEQESPEDFLSRVNRCRWAFTLAALGLGIQTVDLALGRVADLTRGRANDPAIRALLELMESRQWSWWVHTPITWFALIASYALIGKFRTPTWNTRSVALAAMNTVDLGLWLIAHARELGLGDTLGRLLPPFSILRYGLEALQWLELILFAMLCSELGAMIGRKDMDAAQYATRASAMGGLILWATNFSMLVYWNLQRFPRVGWRQQMEWHMFRSMAMVMLAITAFQVTALCLTAARRCRDWLRSQHSASESDLPTASSEAFFQDWQERDRNAWK